MDQTLMETLCNVPAIASHESLVREIIQREANEYSYDLIEDKLGGFAYHQSGTGPKIMLMAHIDEVGFMVKHITPEGMLIVIPIGSVRTLSMYMQKVRVTTYENQQYIGILNAKLNDKELINDLIYVDLGCDSDKEVYELGIDVGNMVTYKADYQQLSENRYCAKALDDRCGIYVLLELMKRMQGDDKDVYYAFSSSEEIGFRGSKTLTEIIQPDIAYVVDVACARDEFDRSYRNNRQIGKGPMILHYDKTMVPNYNLIKGLETVAKHYEINFQKDMFVNGGTDGGSVHLSHYGVPTVVVGIPNRYGHSSYSIGDFRDLENTVGLLSKAIDEVDYESI
ncbi:MAG: hypothetical protein L0L52_01615 [Staphylococcus equorum]|uniref:Aminopeptidase n=1 Tax=Tetragenococcus halophilus subsp. halophilus TaxID=1513897 RepID=A0A2H6CQV9_TETHA|nr:hypothetical protein [Tetragenococcus halophilus]MDN6159842.1 hypothetical protein [Staphylococcus equorum]MDN6161269.1 hypothetical protein [Atopostipes sp.]MDN6266720.1 hypothetical protein [Tetragenococcus koreensis]MDN6730565.1 hypothetical protein [Atopostipes suicloacalis]MDN6670768.1 hypothetical protein [Staphylococcus equorum]